MPIPSLTLRSEFRGAALKGTAIELATRNKTGATQISAADFLNITYPSYDLVKALQAIGPLQDRPVVLIGERGVGKSHLMAVLHHSGTDPEATQAWLSLLGYKAQPTRPRCYQAAPGYEDHQRKADE